MGRIAAAVLLLFLAPFIFFLYLLVRLTSKGGFIYKQLRAGKNQRPFYIYKVRTMVEEAEKLQKKLKYLNEADGPVFKIQNDPRFTKVGRHISRYGLDEILQLWNIVKGEMSFVGPRPLPISEANSIPKKFSKRFNISPGLTSTWVVMGAKHNSFNEWMKMDLIDVEKKSKQHSLLIISRTTIFFIKTLTNIVKKKVS